MKKGTRLMADKPTIRCSSLPILDKCLGMMGADLSINVEQAVTTMGTDIHAYGAKMIRDGEPPEITSTDPEFGFLAASARQAWDDLREFFPAPHVEQRLEAVLPNFLLAGHPDVFNASIAGGAVCVADFKSGYKTDADVLPQLMGYAYLILAKHPDCRSGQVRLIVIWLRDRDIQEWTFTAAQVKDYVRSLHRRAGQWSGKSFTAGEHCQYCPRFYDCPARHQLARSAASDLLALDIEAATRAELAPRMVALYSRFQMLGRQLKGFQKWLHEDLAKNGPMDCRDGRVLQLGKRARTSMDVAKAWPVLRGALDDDELAKCMSITKTKLLAAVAAKSAPRMKGKDKAALMLALEEAGAITIRQEPFIQWRKPETEDQ